MNDFVNPIPRPPKTVGGSGVYDVYNVGKPGLSGAHPTQYSLDEANQLYNVETDAPEFSPKHTYGAARGVSYSAELVAGPTGWQSIPKFVRFAVWLWAIGTALLGTVGVGIGVAFYLAYVISQTNG